MQRFHVTMVIDAKVGSACGIWQLAAKPQYLLVLDISWNMMCWQSNHQTCKATICCGQLLISLVSARANPWLAHGKTYGFDELYWSGELILQVERLREKNEVGFSKGVSSRGRVKALAWSLKPDDGHEQKCRTKSSSPNLSNARKTLI